MDTNTIYTIAFWTAITMLMVGLVFGITAVWIPDIFSDRIVAKLFWTGTILFGVSLAVAVITKMLG